jgi:hypothetical protein
VRQEWLAPPHARGLPEEQSWFLDHFSPGELQRALRHGPGTLLPRTVAMTTLSLVACLAAGGWGASLLVGASGEPDAWATAAVVGAGFALAAVGFHLLRVRAARIMRLRPMNREIIRAHLRGHDLFVAPPNPGADDMSRIDRYAAYAQAFEKAFENDDWSLVEPYFSEDAVYESLEAPPLGYRSEGRSAILEDLKRSLDSLDRRFESRELQLLEGPEERDGRVWIRWRATYRSPSVSELVIEGEETAAFDGDRIRRLEDRFAPGTGERVLAFMEAHAARLAPEPS